VSTTALEKPSQYVLSMMNELLAWAILTSYPSRAALLLEGSFQEILTNWFSIVVVAVFGASGVEAATIVNDGE